MAKAGGYSSYYDIFTPDLGELAFLADEKADHPAYTRGFIWHMHQNVHELVQRAYDWKNAADILFVKGSTDYICRGGKIIQSVNEPSVPEMEAIGGTGDTITGLISALMYKNPDAVEVCLIAALANRIAGKLSQCTPATQIQSIIECIPAALKIAEEPAMKSIMEKITAEPESLEDIIIH